MPQLTRLTALDQTNFRGELVKQLPGSAGLADIDSTGAGEHCLDQVFGDLAEDEAGVRQLLYVLIPNMAEDAVVELCLDGFPLDEGHPSRLQVANAFRTGFLLSDFQQPC